jgi:hypothetical protein
VDEPLLKSKRQPDVAAAAPSAEAPYGYSTVAGALSEKDVAWMLENGYTESAGTYRRRRLTPNEAWNDPHPKFTVSAETPDDVFSTPLEPLPLIPDDVPAAKPEPARPQTDEEYLAAGWVPVNGGWARPIHQREEPGPALPEHPLMQFFSYSHLPEHLQAISKRFFYLAAGLLWELPNNSQRELMLTDLIRAKDAAVRSRVMK